AAKLPCSGDPTAVRRLDLGPTYGYYAVPKKKASGLVVFDHGYQHNAEDWQARLTQTAERDGVIAVAPNYKPVEGTTKRGWWVAEGADATVTAATLFDQACHLQTIVVYGVSMGGN